MRKFFKKRSTQILSVLLLLPLLVQSFVIPIFALDELIPETQVDIPIDTSEDILDEGISDPKEIAEPTLDKDIPVPKEIVKPTWVTSKESATTSSSVVLGEKYVYPNNSDVTVTFSKLPTSSSTLTISTVYLTDEQVKITNAASNVAYDITTDMVDGTFNYDLTLPKVGDSTKVVYAESVSDLVDAKDISNVVENGSSLKIEGLDHFTMFVVVSSIPSGITEGVTEVNNDCTLEVTGSDILCYQSIQEAIDSAENNDVIILQDDIDLGSQSLAGAMVTFSKNNSIVIDLNGHKLSGIDASSANFTLLDVQSGHLTITDNSSTHDGSIVLKAENDGGWSRRSTVVAVGKAEFTLEGGIIRHTGGTSMSYGIDHTNFQSTITISGGEVISESYIGIRIGTYFDSIPTTLNINGGTVKGNTRAVWVQQPSASAAGKVNINISGGTLEATNVANGRAIVTDIFVDTSGSSILDLTINITGGLIRNNSGSPTIYFQEWSDTAVNFAPTINMSGGSIINNGGNGAINIGAGTNFILRKDNITITAGTFSANPSEYIDRTRYAAKLSDGLYTVEKVDKWLEVVVDEYEKGGIYYVQSGSGRFLDFSITSEYLVYDQKIIAGLWGYNPDTGSRDNNKYIGWKTYDTNGATINEDIQWEVITSNWMGGNPPGTTIPEGDYLLWVERYYDGGDYVQGSTITKRITVDNTRPVLSVLTPTTNERISGPVDISITASDSQTDISSVSMHIYKVTEGSDNTLVTGCTSVPTTFDGTNWNATINNGGSCNLAEDTYEIAAWAYDGVKNPGWASRVQFIIDQTPPSVPLNGTPNDTVISTNDFDFTWDASTDATTITYEFQSSLNPAQSGGVLTTGLWKSGILSDNMIHSSGAQDGIWYWQVRAKDAAGNYSNWSDIWTVTLDTQTPSKPVITNTTEFTNVNNITINWKDGDDQGTNPSGVKGYLFRYIFTPANGGTVVNWSSGLVLVGNSKTRTGIFGHGEGKYVMYVQTVDMAGNLSPESVPYTITYDKTKPSIEILGPVENSSHSGSFNIQVKGADTSSGLKQFVVNIKDSQGNNIGTCVNENENGALDHTVTCTINTASYDNGQYSIKTNVTDRAGNMSQTLSRSFIFDNEEPTGDILGIRYPSKDIQNFITNDNTPTIYGSSNDNYGIKSVEVKIGSYISTSGEGGQGFWSAGFGNPIPDGTYPITLTLIDFAGNETTIIQNLTVDTVAPTATHTYLKDGSVIGTSPVVVNNVGQLSFTGNYADSTSGLYWDTFVIFEAQDDGSFAFEQNGKKSYCGWRGTSNTINLSGNTYSFTSPVNFNNCVSTLPNGTYYISHQVFDNATRKDIPVINQYRDVIGLKFTVDATNPDTPTLVSPLNNTFTRGEVLTNSWSDTSTDIDYYIYESYHDSELTDLRWRQNVHGTSKTATNVADATFWWRVQAVDFAGNKSDWSDPWKVTIDNTDPTTPENLYFKDLDNNQDIQCGGYSNTKHISEYWDASVDTNLDHYEYSSYNAPNGSAGLVGKVLYTNSYDTNWWEIPSEGIYGFQVRAVDKAGNKSDWALINATGIENSCQIHIDWTAPVITISAYSTDWTNQDIDVTASTNEGNLNANSHTFTENDSFVFEAKDSAGNTTTQTVNIINIDKTSPTINSMVILNGLLTVTSTDTLSDVKSVEVQINGGTWTPYTPGMNLYTLVSNVPGTYPVSVRVTDNANNATTDSTSFTIPQPQVLGATTGPTPKKSPIYYAQATNTSEIEGENTPDEEEITEEEVLGETTCEATYKISGTVYYDNNDNGIKDDNEKVVKDIKVNIYNSNKELEKTVTTDEKGYWEASLCPGEYTTQVEGAEEQSFVLGDSDTTLDISVEKKTNWWLIAVIGSAVVILLVVLADRYNKRKVS